MLINLFHTSNVFSFSYFVLVWNQLVERRGIDKVLQTEDIEIMTIRTPLLLAVVVVAVLQYVDDGCEEHSSSR